MQLKRFIREIPILPLSALLFYFAVVALWKLGIIPSPAEIVVLLENLYHNYGLVGLSIATFLEGIVYLGLYFPGSFIIALSVFFSNGSFFSLFLISFVVAITLTITSLINYFLGRHIVFRSNKNENLSTRHKVVSKGFLLSLLHPNLLAFYFFNAGLEKNTPWKIVLVPFLMIPYGFFFAWVLSTFKLVLRSKLENPYIMLALILVWITAAFVVEHLSKKRRRLIHQELD